MNTLARYFTGTRAFSSSVQLRTTTMLAGVAFWSLAGVSLSMRNRWPSGDTSYWREGNGSAYLASNTLAGLPALKVDPDVWTGTAMSVFDSSR